MSDKKADCPCKRLHCKRHGDCDACKEHHQNKRHPVACERLEAGKKKDK